MALNSKPRAPSDTLPVWRVEIEAKDEKSMVRIRKRGDLSELWQAIDRWLLDARKDGRCKNLVLTLHQLDCDHEDPS